MSVIYLAGPMTGIKDWNYPAFVAAAKHLRSQGHRVYSPAEFPHAGLMEDFPLRTAFAEYCVFICTEADTIVLLPGWEKSPGANAELSLAKICRLEVVEYEAS